MGSPGTGRVVGAVFGVLFIALAIAILVIAEAATLGGSLVAAAVVGGLGADALVSAIRDKRSLLSRIGPLP